MALLDKLSSYAKSQAKAYSHGNKQTEGLGAELAARSEMNRQGEKALTEQKDTPAPKRDTSGAGVGATPKPYGSQGSEKRIDTSSYTKPLGSYKKGTKRVPKTGTYKLHKGEAVLTKKQNTTAKKKGGFSKLFGGK